MLVSHSLTSVSFLAHLTMSFFANISFPFPYLGIVSSQSHDEFLSKCQFPIPLLRYRF